jgi:hypothetical protein
MVVARDPREQTDESWSTAFTKVDPQVVGEWSLSVGTLDLAQQFIDVGHVPIDETSLDFEDCHFVQATEG